MNITKICRCCQVTVTAENGTTDRQKAGGFASICKACNSKRMAEWKRANPDKVKLQKQREYNARKEKPGAIARQRQATKKWFRKTRNNGVEGKTKILIGSVKSRARKLNVPFDLDADYLLSIATENCPVDGLPMDWAMEQVTSGRATDRSPSIDRIIPSLGYTKGNVKFIANKWNAWKSNMLVKDLELIIAYMEKYSP